LIVNQKIWYPFGATKNIAKNITEHKNGGEVGF